MFDSFRTKLVRLFASDILDVERLTAFNQASQQIHKLREESDSKTTEFLIKQSIGRKIIYCPNEWEDPIFAVVTGATTITAANKPMLTYTNVLTDEQHIVGLNTFFIADEQMTKTILKLNPFERWNMAVGTKAHMSNMWRKGYSPDKPITPSENLTWQLREKGFMFQNEENSYWLDEYLGISHQLGFLFEGLTCKVLNCTVSKQSDSSSMVWPRDIYFNAEWEVEEFKRILGYIEHV